MAGPFGNRPPREKNGLDNRKLALSTPTPGAQGKFARLDWSIVNANPRVTVYTNDPNDPGEGGRIAGAFDIVGFITWIEKFNWVISDAPNGYKDKVSLKNFRYFGPGKKSERPEVISELWFGKDEQGVCWISLLDALKRERPKIKFEFANNDWYEWHHGDGTPYSKGEISAAFARGYTKLLPLMMSHMATVDYTPPEPKQPPGGGQGGGGGYGGGNRGGGYGGGGGGGGYGGGGNRGGGGDAPAGGGGDKGDDIPF